MILCHSEDVLDCSRKLRQQQLPGMLLSSLFAQESATFPFRVGLTGFSVPPSPPEEISAVHGIWSYTLQSLEALAAVHSGHCPV